jgi:serine/threonine protein kinase
LLEFSSVLCSRRPPNSQSNILVNDEGKASLTDFGLSLILRESGFTTKTTSGTWRFMAPELMIAEEVQIQVTPATDVWAFGMTVIEVCIYYCQWQISTKYPTDLHSPHAVLEYHQYSWCHCHRHGRRTPLSF